MRFWRILFMVSLFLHAGAVPAALPRYLLPALPALRRTCSP
jgi:hypothetical protein